MELRKKRVPFRYPMLSPPLRIIGGFFLVELVLLFGPRAAAQSVRPVKEWDRAYGGSRDDALRGLRFTPDGGYIMAGYSVSGPSGDRSQPSRGTPDYWVVKADANGVKQWDRAFGDLTGDDLATVRLTADGGYLLAGDSFAGAAGDKSQPSRGASDYWVVKLDAAGTKQWDRTFGGRDAEFLSDVWPTRDGGYLLAGRSFSAATGDRSQPSRGGNDMWVVKIDATGTKQWDYAYGGTGDEYLAAVQQTTDGGFILGGSSYSGVSGEKSQPARGLVDYWIVKIDAAGTKQWDRTYGGTGEEYLASLQQTTDGGYVLAGTSNSGISGEKSQSSAGRLDFWVIKTDAAGNKQWDQVLASGSSPTGYVHVVRQTSDGGYMAAGEFAVPNLVFPSMGTWDFYVAKLDPTGGKQWDRTVVTPGYEQLLAAEQLADGGYVLAGGSSSTVGGDRSATGQGGADFWVVKLSMPHISGDTRLCAGETVQLSAPTGGRTYAWSTGATTAAITVTQPGVYTVAYTEPDGTVNTLQQTVTAFQPPAPVITGDSLACPGAGVSLGATAPGATGFRWNTGATTPTLLATQPGWYSVVASFGNGCTSSAQWRVRQRPAVAPFGLGADTTVCEGTVLLLRAPAPRAVGETYRWSDGSTDASLKVRTTGLYELQITGCGTQTANRRVRVESCVQIGTVITPNADGRNDRFEARNLPGTDWSLAVYNRWGRQVYNTAAYHNDWGDAASAGVYYYLLRQPTTGTTYKGWVEVVR